MNPPTPLRFLVGPIKQAILFALTLILWAQPTWATPPNLSISDVKEHALTLRHQGDPTQIHGIEITRDFQTWDLIGTSTADANGFVFEDPLAFLKDSTLFYRMSTDFPEAVHRWRTDYPIEYRDGEEMDALPSFTWQPFPLPGATYHFEIFSAILDGTGQPVALDQALVSAAALPSPELILAFPESPFEVSAVYAYRVIAEMAGRRVIGRWVPVGGFGLVHLADIPLATPADPPNGTAPRGGTKSTSYKPGDWATLLRLLNKLAQQKAEIQEALAKNDLVEETALIRQLAELLKAPPELQEILESLLANPESLTDPTSTLKALCYTAAHQNL